VKIKPCFPLSHGLRRANDRRVISGIIYVIRNGLQWKMRHALMGQSAQNRGPLATPAIWSPPRPTFIATGFRLSFP
jgi:transposase